MGDFSREELAKVLAAFEIEPGVDVEHLDTSMLPLLQELSRAARMRGVGPLRITSGFRETHPVRGGPDRGFHGIGLALDIGAAGMRPDVIRDLAYYGRSKGFQAVEQPHGTGPHIHFEFDTPKTKARLPK